MLVGNLHVPRAVASPHMKYQEGMIYIKLTDGTVRPETFYDRYYRPMMSRFEYREGRLRLVEQVPKSNEKKEPPKWWLN